MILTHLMDGDDVVVLQGGSGTRFAEEPLTVALISGQRRLHDLERHWPLELRIFGVEDNPHAAGAQHFEHPIRTKPA